MSKYVAQMCIGTVVRFLLMCFVSEFIFHDFSILKFQVPKIMASLLIF